MALSWLSQKLHIASNPGELHSEAHAAAQKFDADELYLLQKTWQDLSDHTNGKGINKDTFLQFFPLGGLLGERLFTQFDRKKCGMVDFDDFVMGLATCSRGDEDERAHFMFSMFDVLGDNQISKEELALLLNHIPKDLVDHSTPHSATLSDTRDRALSRDRDISMDSLGMSPPRISSLTKQMNAVTTNGALEAQGPTPEKNDIKVGGVDVGDNTPIRTGGDGADLYTNIDLVHEAFEDFDLSHEGRLSYEEFRMWVRQNPLVLQVLDACLPLGHHKGHSEVAVGLQTVPHAGGDQPHFQNPLPLISQIRSRSASKKGDKGSSSSSRARSESMESGSRTMSGSHTSMALEVLLNSPAPPSGHTSPVGWSGRNLLEAEPEVKALLAQAKLAAKDADLRHIISNFTLLLETGGAHGPNGHLGQPEFSERQTSLDGFDLGSSPLSPLSVEFEARLNVAREDSEVLYERLYESLVSKEGYLWKKGQSILHAWTKRYYIVSGNVMYYFASQNDTKPRGVIFLTGSLVDGVVNKEDNYEAQGYFGLEVLHQDLCTGEHHRHERRVLYCQSAEERAHWVSVLHHASEVIPIEDEYTIGKELGRGKFSQVCECVHKDTKERRAVKIITKEEMSPEEKSLLRSEIAVLKLVNHPNIIQMMGVFESRTHIYLVLELLEGGELFSRIVGKPRFTDAEACGLIRPLLESVAYLHDLGIVHRDIKPENILCGADLDDVKIADFGLSQMLLPLEQMTAACGTVSYVAPEVLSLKGYGKAADLWSLGVVMFLVLNGKLPFEGNDTNEIINAIVNRPLKIGPNTRKRLHPHTVDILEQLLCKDPEKRVTAKAALKHPFLQTFSAPMPPSTLVGEGATATTVTTNENTSSEP